MKNKAELINHLNAKHSVKFLFFWGHTVKGNGVCKACLSQWYDSPFEADGVLYQTAEHYMMAQKAKLFHDEKAYQRILACKSPKAAKAIGREIVDFSEAVWLEHRFDIVVAGNLAKFSHYPELRQYLLNTNNRVLVEASPVDTIWGVGLAADHPEIENPRQWRGLNLLGFVLMQVRNRLNQG